MSADERASSSALFTLSRRDGNAPKFAGQLMQLPSFSVICKGSTKGQHPRVDVVGLSIRQLVECGRGGGKKVYLTRSMLA